MNCEVLAMSQAERDRLCVIRAASEGRLLRRDAAAQMDITTRQLRRLVKRFREVGDAVAIHGLRGRPGNRGLSLARRQLRRDALRLFRKSYDDYGPVLLSETLGERHKLVVPRETLRCWLLAAKLRSLSRRTRVRHLRRPRRPRFGELLQMDTSIHDWFEGRGHGRTMLSLIKIIDDATGEVFGLFFEGDTVLGNLAVLEAWIRDKGRPLGVYVDCHTHFAGRPEKDLADRRYETQIGRCLKELQIALTLARSPQAKGRVERGFRTHQDRLVKKLRERGISTLEAANAYLPQYWAEHKRRFARPPVDAQDAHRPLTIDQKRRLHEIFAVRETRSLQVGQIVRYEGRELLVDVRGRRGPYPGVQVEVVTDKSGKMHICWKGVSLPFRDITDSRPQRQEASKRETEASLKRKSLLLRLGRAGINPARAKGLSHLEIEALIPPRTRAAGTHPWRKTGSG